MDGVLVDSLPIHCQAEKETLASVGIIIEADEILERFNGIHDNVWFKVLADENGIDINMDKLLNKKWKIVYENIKKKSLTMPNGSLNLLASVFDKEYPIGLASGSPPHFIKYAINTLGIAKYFKSINSSEEVKRGKPYPDLFFLSAKNIERSPENCLVIEDARSGMIAANKAGMKCIGLVDDITGDYPADFLVDALTKVTPKTIQSLLKANH